jgi:hypothetical protein
LRTINFRLLVAVDVDVADVDLVRRLPAEKDRGGASAKRTRRICEKIAQYEAKPILCQNYALLLQRKKVAAKIRPIWSPAHQFLKQRSDPKLAKADQS